MINNNLNYSTKLLYTKYIHKYHYVLCTMYINCCLHFTYIILVFYGPSQEGNHVLTKS